MFIIIGGDGKEYGPATVSQVRGWLEGGRANTDTRAKRVGTEEWRRLGDFVEFGGVEVVAPVVMVAPATECSHWATSSPTPTRPAFLWRRPQVLPALADCTATAFPGRRTDCPASPLA